MRPPSRGKAGSRLKANRHKLIQKKLTPRFATVTSGGSQSLGAGPRLNRTTAVAPARMALTSGPASAVMIYGRRLRALSTGALGAPAAGPSHGRRARPFIG